jgi:NADH:ubiquinone oxidoreductase subunit H
VLLNLLNTLLYIILLILPLILAVAFLTLAERKVIGAIQQRTGPQTQKISTSIWNTYFLYFS